MNKVDQQPAFIINSSAFKESSLIYQVFTRDFGLVSVLSKGVKSKNSKYGANLQPLIKVHLSWVGKSDLKTLTAVDTVTTTQRLNGKALFCGFYLSELIQRLLQKHDAHPRLFNAFETVIEQLAVNQAIEPALRYFELTLLNEIGYGVSFEQTADSQQAIQTALFYQYNDLLDGFVRCEQEKRQAISGLTLLNLQQNTLTDRQQLKEAKQLMRQLIERQLDGKPLKSRELFQSA